MIDKVKQDAEEMMGRLRNNFTYHPPKEGQIQRYKEIRDKAREFAEFLVMTTPPSREQSVALTELESVVFWANAAIARNE